MTRTDHFLIFLRFRPRPERQRQLMRGPTYYCTVYIAPPGTNLGPVSTWVSEPSLDFLCLLERPCAFGYLLSTS